MTLHRGGLKCITSVGEQMRKLPAALVGLVVAIAIFAAGAYVSAERRWLQPLATVRIENHSGQDVASLRIAFLSYEFKGQLEAPPPKSGSSIEVSFPHRGEGGCQVAVTLADGKAFVGTCGYTETGYFHAFKVMPNGITGGLNQTLQ